MRPTRRWWILIPTMVAAWGGWWWLERRQPRTGSEMTPVVAESSGLTRSDPFSPGIPILEASTERDRTPDRRGAGTLADADQPETPPEPGPGPDAPGTLSGLEGLPVVGELPPAPSEPFEKPPGAAAVKGSAFDGLPGVDDQLELAATSVGVDAGCGGGDPPRRPGPAGGPAGRCRAPLPRRGAEAGRRPGRRPREEARRGLLARRPVRRGAGARRGDLARGRSPGLAARRSGHARVPPGAGPQSRCRSIGCDRRSTAPSSGPRRTTASGWAAAISPSATGGSTRRSPGSTPAGGSGPTNRRSGAPGSNGRWPPTASPRLVRRSPTSPPMTFSPARIHEAPGMVRRPAGRCRSGAAGARAGHRGRSGRRRRPRTARRAGRPATAAPRTPRGSAPQGRARRGTAPLSHAVPRGRPSRKHRRDGPAGGDAGPPVRGPGPLDAGPRAGPRRRRGPRPPSIVSPRTEPARPDAGRTLAEVLAEEISAATEAIPRRPTAAAPPRRVVPLFRDDAGVAGLHFTFQNGDTEKKQLPEASSGGVGLLDYDGDGRLDVYLVQGGTFPPGRVPASHGRPPVPQPRQRDLRGRHPRLGPGGVPRRLWTWRRRGRLRQRRPSGRLRHPMAVLCALSQPGRWDVRGRDRRRGAGRRPRLADVIGLRRLRRRRRSRPVCLPLPRVGCREPRGLPEPVDRPGQPLRPAPVRRPAGPPLPQRRRAVRRRHEGGGHRRPRRPRPGRRRRRLRRGRPGRRVRRQRRHGQLPVPQPRRHEVRGGRPRVGRGGGRRRRLPRRHGDRPRRLRRRRPARPGRHQLLRRVDDVSTRTSAAACSPTGRPRSAWTPPAGSAWASASPSSTPTPTAGSTS